MKGDKGVVIPDPRLLVCCMVDWGKVVAIPFLSFFPFLGKKIVFSKEEPHSANLVYLCKTMIYINHEHFFSYIYLYGCDFTSCYSDNKNTTEK